MKEWWIEYFKEILNRLFLIYEFEISEFELELNININLLDVLEIILVIQCLKNGKFFGSDNLNVELFKMDLFFIVIIF